MPYVEIVTNVELDQGAQRSLTKKVSALASSLLGKPEQWVMVRVQESACLSHGGGFEPAAFCRFMSIGLDTGACAGLSGALCEVLDEQVSIPKDRVYIEFRELERELFGWNGGTF